MLFESLKHPQSGVYITQPVLTLRGRLDREALEAAWRDVIAQFAILRTAFSYHDRTQPLQVVFQTPAFALAQEDWRDLAPHDQMARLDNYLAAAKRRGFDFSRAPLMAVALLRFADEDYRLVWTHHHIILDGWSLPRVFEALCSAYAARVQGQSPGCAPANPMKPIFAGFKRRTRARPKPSGASIWRGWKESRRCP